MYGDPPASAPKVPGLKVCTAMPHPHSFLFLLIFCLFRIMCTYVFMYGCVHVRAGAHEGQERASDLGTKLRSSERAAHTFNR